MKTRIYEPFDNFGYILDRDLDVIEFDGRMLRRGGGGFGRSSRGSGGGNSDKLPLMLGITVAAVCMGLCCILVIKYACCKSDDTARPR